MRYILFLLTAALFLSCHSGKNTPDVSNIKVSLQVKRLDKDFFQIDTTRIAPSLDHLQQQYGPFLNDYLYQILGLPAQQDSVVQRTKLFLQSYRPLADSVQQKFASTDALAKEVTHGLKFVHYYFPKYPLPTQLITFVGPIESYANVLTSEGLAVGLQLYMGQNFSAYQNDYVREIYPTYQSHRFEAPYITVGCMQNIVNDMYPAKNADAPLIEQMIELGKRMYIIDHLLPETADSVKIGYTQKQWDGCNENESFIWNFFVKNDLLLATDPVIIHDYVNDGPKTSALGEAAPGFIGKFVGWQIVKKWMGQNTSMTLSGLMETPARKIYEEAKYKPR